MQKSYFNNVRQRSRSHLAVAVQTITFRARSTSLKPFKIYTIHSTISCCTEKKDHNPTFSFDRMVPFCKFYVAISYKLCVFSISFKLFKMSTPHLANCLRFIHGILYKYTAPSDVVQRKQNHNFTFSFGRMVPLCIKDLFLIIC